MHEVGRETGLDDLRAELAELEAEEKRVSAVRRRLHHQIDFGFGSESSREREREISEERQQIHRRIAFLRELLSSRQESAG
jgi:50S ribosomal subunit-associated GTPase HflX